MCVGITMSAALLSLVPDQDKQNMFKKDKGMKNNNNNDNNTTKIRFRIISGHFLFSMRIVRISSPTIPEGGVLASERIMQVRAKMRQYEVGDATRWEMPRASAYQARWLVSW